MTTPTLVFLAESLWKDKSFSDVSLEFAGRHFRTHRLLLRQSPYLGRQLDKSQRDATVLPLKLDEKHVTGDALDVCLSTLYGLQPVFDEDNILAVLACAFVLELDTLCDSCIAFLPNIVTPALFLQLHAFNQSWNGREYSESLREVLEGYLCRTAYLELRPFLHQLPRIDLKNLFASNALWVPTESDRFQLIMEVYQAMREHSQQEPQLMSSLSALESRLPLPFKVTAGGGMSSSGELQSSSDDLQRSASSEPTIQRERTRNFECNRVCSVPGISPSELNCGKFSLTLADSEFLESMLDDEKIFYSCFSFADLVRARNQAQSLGLSKVVRCIENSLWIKSTLEGIIISEATKKGDLRSARSFDKQTNMDLVGVMSEDDSTIYPSFRYSTKIDNIEAFQSNRDFTSDQFYFCGSLFRVVLTIRCDQEADEHYVGMYLQRTMISNVDSWQFCDPRSNVNVHVEFIAGTRVLEMIELDGRLEVPHNNKGYSRFLRASQLQKYLSPTGSLRITAILRLMF